MKRALLALALVAAIVLAWAPALDAPFTYDDRIEVVGNRTIRALGEVGAIASYNTSRPLLIATYALNWRLGGLDPFGYHVLSVALHALNALLAWRLAGRLLAPERAALVACLWALHPMTTDAVTYITGRSDVLQGTWWLVALTAWIDHRRGARHARGIATVAVIAALLTKEVGILLPVALAAADRWLAPAPRWRDHLPFLVAGAAAVALRLYVYGLPAAEVPRAALAQLLSQAEVWARYLGLWLVPVGQSILHDHPGVARLAGAAALAAWLAAGAALAWRARRAEPGSEADRKSRTEPAEAHPDAGCVPAECAGPRPVIEAGARPAPEASSRRREGFSVRLSALGSMAGRVGEHWLAAGHPARAAEPLLTAAAEKARVSAISDVGVLLRAARTALETGEVPTRDPRWGLYLEWNMWLQCTAVSPAAGALAAKALVDWATETGDVPRSIMGRVRYALNRAYAGEPVDAVSELRALWREAQDGVEGWAYLAAGDFFATELRNCGLLPEAEEVARTLLARGEATGDRHMRGNATRHLAMFARMAGRLDEAHALCDRAIPLQTPGSWAHADALIVRADAFREGGHFDEAVALYTEAARILHAIGSFDANVPLLNTSIIRIEQGRMDEADAILQRCVVSLHQSEQRRMEAIARVLRLAPLAHRGDREGFLAELAAGKPVLDDTHYVDPDVAVVLGHAAREAAARGWPDEARAVAAWAHAQWLAFGRTEEAAAVAALWLG